MTAAERKTLEQEREREERIMKEAGWKIERKKAA